MPAQTMTSDRAATVVGSDGDQRRRWWILAVLFLARTCMALQFQVLGAIAPLASAAMNSRRPMEAVICTRPLGDAPCNERNVARFERGLRGLAQTVFAGWDKRIEGVWARAALR